jgi:hypothetical protein
LQLARKCYELRELKVAFTSISNDILIALSDNCPHLDTLHCCWASAVTEFGVEVTAQVLSRLRELVVHGQGGFCAASYIAALQHTTGLQKIGLHVDYFCISMSVVDAVCKCGSGDLRSVILNCAVDTSTSLTEIEAPLIMLAQRNPRLTHLHLHGRQWGSPGLVLALAQHCPRLSELKFIGPSTGIADESIVALAQRCPQLRVLQGVFGTATTDTAVLAVAQHCRVLQRGVDFGRSVLVSAVAILELVQKCRHLTGFLSLPKNVLPEDAQRIRTAYARVQKSPAGVVRII